MLNRRMALTLAIIGGILTLLAGVFQDVRLMTIGYRSLVSSLIFGICGYLLGNVIDSYRQRLEDSIKPKGQTIDIISKDEDPEISQPPLPEPENTGFRPFTPDTFDQLTSKQ